MKDPGKFSQVKKACNRCVIYVLRVIYEKFKRIVLLSYIKDLSSFFTLQKKILRKFYNPNFVNFLNFCELISCSQIMWLCFAILEFEMYYVW